MRRSSGSRRFGRTESSPAPARQARGVDARPGRSARRRSAPRHRRPPRRGLRDMNEQRLTTSVLVIGTGAAGLRAAIELQEQGVQVLCVGKRRRDDAHTVLASGGINAALGTMDPEDSWEQHAADTLREGYWLGDPLSVELLCREAPAAIDDLVRWGARAGPRGGRAPHPALLRRPPVPANVFRGRLHGPRDPADAGRPSRRARGRHSRRRLRDPTARRTTAASFGAYGFDVDDGAPAASSPTRSCSPPGVTRGSGAAPLPGATRTPAMRCASPPMRAAGCATWSSSSSTPPGWCTRRSLRGRS